MTINDLLFSIAFDVIVSMVPLSVKPFFLIDGFGKYFGRSGAKLVVCTTATLTFLSLATPLLCFIYRYSVSTNKTAATVNKTQSQSCKSSTLFMAIGFELFCAVTTFIVVFIVTETDQRLLRLKNLPMIKLLNSTEWQNRILFAFGERVDFLPVIVSVIVPIMVIIATVSCITLAALIITSLNSQKSSMTATTFAMQKRFTHALIIQALYPAILLSLPYLSMVFDIQFGLLRNSGLMNVIHFVSLASVSLYPIVNAIVTIYFVTPYRIVAVDTLKWIFVKSYQNRLVFRKDSWGSRYFGELAGDTAGMMEKKKPNSGNGEENNDEQHLHVPSVR